MAIFVGRFEELLSDEKHERWVKIKVILYMPSSVENNNNNNNNNNVLMSNRMSNIWRKNECRKRFACINRKTKSESYSR